MIPVAISDPKTALLLSLGILGLACLALLLVGVERAAMERTLTQIRSLPERPPA